jgi:hypothetical protein
MMSGLTWAIAVLLLALLFSYMMNDKDDFSHG